MNGCMDADSGKQTEYNTNRIQWPDKERRKHTHTKYTDTDYQIRNRWGERAGRKPGVLMKGRSTEEQTRREQGRQTEGDRGQTTGKTKRHKAWKIQTWHNTKNTRQNQESWQFLVYYILSLIFAVVTIIPIIKDYSKWGLQVKGSPL